MSKPSSHDFDSVAEQLRDCDVELLRLIDRRADLVRQADGLTLKQELAGLEEAAAGSQTESGEAALTLLAEVVLWGRRRVQPLRVAYLGPAYSYSHLAAIDRFGAATELVPVATIAAVFEEVARGHCQFGVAPLENSTDGRVVDTLDMFSRCPLKICGEAPLPIRHCLLGIGPRSRVTEVFSKPQALSQCRDWLANHLPAARLVEMPSTTEAAAHAAADANAAAVAARAAAVPYGLEVLAEDIQDAENNVTRFAVLGDAPAPPSGNDKTALMFQVPHQPGALVDAMSTFHRSGLNMTWIESFPCRASTKEYLFFVELQGHQEDPAVRQALAELQSRTVRLEVLGSYPSA